MTQHNATSRMTSHRMRRFPPNSCANDPRARRVDFTMTCIRIHELRFHCREPATLHTTVERSAGPGKHDPVGRNAKARAHQFAREESDAFYLPIISKRRQLELHGFVRQIERKEHALRIHPSLESKDGFAGRHDLDITTKENGLLFAPM